MAKRPVFIPQNHGLSFVDVESIDFEWYPGLALSQKQKSILSLHSSASKICKLNNILEVSTKSQNKLGVKLSAFNLAFHDCSLKKSISVECVYQASKVFEGGGPFLDILQMTSLSAKKDERLIVSGRLIGFYYSGVKWMLEPCTAFYDWIYINALFQHPDIALDLSEFDGFTDIEFNPKKSIGCQAYSVALFLSLLKRGLLDKAISSPDAFLECMEDSQKVRDQRSLF